MTVLYPQLAFAHNEANRGSAHSWRPLFGESLLANQCSKVGVILNVGTVKVDYTPIEKTMIWMVTLAYNLELFAVSEHGFPAEEYG